MNLNTLRQELKSKADPEQGRLLQGFFKTGPGQYGEGDVFLGIKVPEVRKVVKKYSDIELEKVEQLLHSKIHEHRLCALLILVSKFERGQGRDVIFKTYLKNTKYINNWDLVDLSAHKIVGAYLVNRPRDILYKLARSKSLWERRISIISCFAFIRSNDFKDALKISQILLHDKHDLIHKAVGWMLREIGKKDLETEEAFLKKYYKSMPRTMLRYSIERFEENKRQAYLKGTI